MFNRPVLRAPAVHGVSSKSQVRFLWWPTCTRYDSCGTSTILVVATCTGTILVVADLYKYDSCVKLREKKSTFTMIFCDIAILVF